MSTTTTTTTSTAKATESTKEVKQMFLIDGIEIGEFVTPTIVKLTGVGGVGSPTRLLMAKYVDAHKDCEYFERKDGVEFLRIKCSESMFVFLYQVGKDWGFKNIAKFVWKAFVEGCKDSWKTVITFFKTLPEQAKTKWAEFVMICKNLGKVSLSEWMMVLGNIIITVCCAILVVMYPTLAVSILVGSWVCGTWVYLSKFVQSHC